MLQPKNLSFRAHQKSASESEVLDAIIFLAAAPVGEQCVYLESARSILIGIAATGDSGDSAIFANDGATTSRFSYSARLCHKAAMPIYALPAAPPEPALAPPRNLLHNPVTFVTFVRKLS